ncbi:hypothetical protein LguiB_034451 [Lonicera macranthoides]
MLHSVGALQATSVPKLGLADFLSSRESFLEKMVTRDATPSTNTTATTSIGVVAPISASIPPPPRCTVTHAIANVFNSTSHLPKRPGIVVMPPLFYNLFLIFNTFAVTASVLSRSHVMHFLHSHLLFNCA